MSRARLRSAAAAAALVLAAVVAAPAHADGDPASDVLVSQAVFVPTDAGGSAAEAAQLAALAREARRAGFPVKVAVVASRYDLGAVTALWGRPQTYARFLGVELSLLYHGRLLVVMPSGLGLARAGASDPGLAALRGVEIDRNDLVGTATTAVRRLAAANGHPLALPRPASAPAVPGGGGSRLPWVAFGVGLLLVALAWAASFRVRPPRRRVKPS